MIVFCFMGLIGSEVSVLQGRSSVPPPSLWSVRIVFYRKVVGAKSPIIDNGCLGQEMTESDWCLSGYFILGRSDWCWCPYSSVFFVAPERKVKSNGHCRLSIAIYIVVNRKTGLQISAEC